MYKLSNLSQKLTDFINNNSQLKDVNITKWNTINKIFNSFNKLNKNYNIILSEKDIIQKIRNKYTDPYPKIYEKYKDKYNYKTFFNMFNQNLINKTFDIDIKNKILKNILYNNNYISLDIIDFAETNDLIYYKYNLDDITLNIFFTSTLKDDNPNINYIFLIVKVLQSLSNKSDKSIILNLLITPLNKVLKNELSDDTVLTQFNVNSGLSYNNIINIWRREELYKVLMHELIHNLNLDDKHIIYNHNFNIKQSEININEAYVETFAEIINCIFISFILDKNLNNFKKYMLYEINYSAFQTAKILNFFKIKRLQDVLVKNTNINNSNSINQTSNVFSYYIIKAAIMHHILCNKTDDFVKLLEMSLLKNNINFSNCVDNYIKLLSTIYNNDITNNLRMTCLELSK